LREILHVIEGNSTKFHVALLFQGEDREEIEQLSREVWKASHRFFENLGSMIPPGRSSLTIRSPLNPEEDITGSLKRLLDAINSRLHDYGTHETANVILERVSNSLYHWLSGLRKFIRQEIDGYVYWLERTADDLFGGIACHAQPVDVSGLMRREVMDDHASVFFVSATLSVSDRFTFIERRLGIENHDILSIPSPFDYQKQSLLYIPGSMPDPDEEEYMERALQEISGIVDILDGNCLLLFTSHMSLKAFAETLKKRTERPVVAQGDMEASGAIDHFRSLDGGLLLGTHAMWQGIDLPGDQLRGVIIMRFPFEVPDNPVHQARMERLEQMGLNPFLSYAMPQAVIRLKQGFGRLIRGKRDRGIIAILDNRIVNRRYGKHFMKSIPDSPVVTSMSRLQEEYREMRGKE
jgi:ATP-dependent DNA helicase DinG